MWDKAAGLPGFTVPPSGYIAHGQTEETGLPLMRATGQVILCHILGMGRLTVAGQSVNVGVTNGKDANNGHSQETPRKNIANVDASRFNPGDERQVMGEKLTCQFLMI
jgi:hypothetical protein